MTAEEHAWAIVNRNLNFHFDKHDLAAEIVAAINAAVKDATSAVRADLTITKQSANLAWEEMKKQAIRANVAEHEARRLKTDILQERLDTTKCIAAAVKERTRACAAILERHAVALDNAATDFFRDRLRSLAVIREGQAEEVRECANAILALLTSASAPAPSGQSNPVAAPPLAD